MHHLGSYLVHAALWSLVRTQIYAFTRHVGAGPIVALFVVLCVAFLFFNRHRRRARV